MTAGRGIVHCEMPHGTEQAHGLQLWVNLASKDKMTPPAYQELLDKDIPKTKQNGVHVKVIAGESLGIKVGVTIVLCSKRNSYNVYRTNFKRKSLQNGIISEVSIHSILF